MTQADPRPDARSRRTILITVVAAALVAVLAFAGILWAVNGFGQNAADPRPSATTGGDAPVDDIDGVSYENAEYGYRVVFPGTPAEQSQTLPVQGFEVELLTVTWEEGEEALIANSARFPEELLGDVETMLDGAVTGAIGNVPGGQLISAEAATLDGMPAREVRADTSVGPIRMILAMGDGVQYQLIAGNSDDERAEAFFASFHRV